MLTNNFKVLPDLHGNPLQRYAAAILEIDPHADCPTDLRSARALLDTLQRKQLTKREPPNELRLSQIHQVWNALLPQLNKARKLGIRGRGAETPKIPEGGIVTPDDLQRMTEFSAQLDEDIAEFESKTLDQRRIDNLEAGNAAFVKAYNLLARECNEQATRIAALEAIIRGRAAAA